MHSAPPPDGSGDGRTVNVHALVAVGADADGQREVPGPDVASGEDGAGWLAFLRSLTARGLSGVRLVVNGLAVVVMGLRFGNVPLRVLIFEWLPRSGGAGTSPDGALATPPAVERRRQP